MKLKLCVIFTTEVLFQDFNSKLTFRSFRRYQRFSNELHEELPREELLACVQLLQFNNFFTIITFITTEIYHNARNRTVERHFVRKYDLPMSVKGDEVKSELSKEGILTVKYDRHPEQQPKIKYLNSTCI
ncbi:hypothetical protein NECAME_15580 [Necator americanus]|uniref:SHSP domain-containing protein n=1 Tax=Necator americanus TaxID=51031 RepID=W2SJ38_NECAM|nr:hypothetical protein NECAME_15580 [Necator americanus]ETN68876.1 hypothetical protein NECAME_15580 [Necator americanus]